MCSPERRSGAGAADAATTVDDPADVRRRRRIAHLRVARLIAEPDRDGEIARDCRRTRERQLHANQGTRARTRRAAGPRRPERDRSAGGQTISSTVTPAGASIVSVVGMSSGSRGLFDCVCSPSGSVTFRATRDGRTGARGPLDQRSDVRPGAPAIGRRQRPWPSTTNARTRRRFTIARLRPTSVDLLHGDEYRMPDSCADVPSNFTGGMSWNMRSHFHRSDGFDACSQFCAVTGRANARFVSPA